MLLALTIDRAKGAAQRPVVDLEALPYAPRQYVAYRTPAAIDVDGQLNEPAWSAAAWTDAFVDIEGGAGRAPRLMTRARMLWDDDYFYVAADMEEPDVWATLVERDAVIFHDNDFELFIDPDGDSHLYYELEVNALGTPWDLMLIKPYRDGGPALNGWDIAGLQARVNVRGTLNRPGDRDDGWTIEIAMPWTILKEAAPEHRRPRAGERWRVNFSRVEWQVDVVDGRYTKRLKPGSKDALPESNWVWSPQGAIDMHMPERWGTVQFSSRTAGSGVDSFVDDPNEQLKWALRRLYYRQRRFRAANGVFANTLARLDARNITLQGREFRPVLAMTSTGYEISAPGFDDVEAHVNHEGRVWTTPERPDGR
jgi:hypothetical protein